MKRYFSLIMILLLAVLVACGGAENIDTDDTTDAGSTGDTASETTTSPEVAYTVSGAVDASAQGNLNFFCDDGDGVFEQFYEFGALIESQQLNLTLQPELSGTVDLIGSDNEGANPGAANYVDYRSEDLTNYELGTGTLTIESYPAAVGDMFIATMTAELSDEEGNTVTIEASFNETASRSAYEDDCASE